MTRDLPMRSLFNSLSESISPLGPHLRPQEKGTTNGGRRDI